MQAQIAIPFGAKRLDAGRLTFDLSATARGISRLALHRNRPGVQDSNPRSSALIGKARRELAEYLSGQRSYFGVPVDLSGLAGFDLSALQVAAAIPYGEVRTYKSIAEQLGSREASRAVGHAMATNPVPIIIPCHRVIKTDGGLGGYLYGLDVKQELLDLERSTPPLVGCASTRIVCYRGCPHEKRIKEAGRVSFRSLAEAEAGGFRPCLICMQAPAIVAHSRTLNHPQ